MLWSSNKYLPVVITTDTSSIRLSILSSETFPKNKIVAHKSIQFNSRHNVGEISEELIHTLVIILLIYHTFIYNIYTTVLPLFTKFDISCQHASIPWVGLFCGIPVL